jgi:hypothetical protein
MADGLGLTCCFGRPGNGAGPPCSGRGCHVAVSGGRPGQSGNRRRKMSAILLSIIGLAALIIIGAVNGSHGSKQPASAQGIASFDAGAASALAPTSITPAAVSQSAASTKPAAHAPAAVHTQAAASSPAAAISRTAAPRASATHGSTPRAQPTHSASPSPAAAAPASCHPLTNGGNCYEPGEYCRNSDHGVTGVAGDGKTTVCEDNDGWRWEPV